MPTHSSNLWTASAPSNVYAIGNDNGEHPYEDIGQMALTDGTEKGSIVIEINEWIQVIIGQMLQRQRSIGEKKFIVVYTVRPASLHLFGTTNGRKKSYKSRRFSSVALRLWNSFPKTVRTIIE